MVSVSVPGKSFEVLSTVDISEMSVSTHDSNRTRNTLNLPVCLQVKKSLDLEQTKTSSLDQSLSQLNKSVIAVQAVVRGLEKRDRQVREEMQLLSGSFNSLLQDTSRHNDVLELLLSEEVQEFLEWPVQDQEGNSIPALKEELRNLQEQLNSRAGITFSV